MTKILRITTVINRGSIGRTAEQLGELIQAEGWESYICYGRESHSSTSKLVPIGNKFSVFFHVLMTRVLGFHGRYASVYATHKLTKDIQKISPDIIHLHNVHGYYLNYKILFKFLAKYNRPVVWTHHDCWPISGHCTYYEIRGKRCDKWLTGCYNCPRYKEYPNSLFFDRSEFEYKDKKKYFNLINNLTIVAVSEYVKNSLAESFLRNNKIIRIYNGIDTEKFKPYDCSEETRKKYNLGNNVILMAVAYQWDNEKGFNDYIKLSKMLDSNFTIVLVGCTDDDREKLPGGMIGLNRTDSLEELGKLYSVASIVLNLSTAEAFGKTTPEGLACGVPSVVYNVTASPELVDYKTGRVVEVGDLTGVKKAIDELMSIDRITLQKDCRDRAVSLFNMKTNFYKYIELYKSLL